MEPGAEGQRLDRFISSRIPRLSRARAARLEVVDLEHPTRRLKKSTHVQEGWQLWVRRPMPDAEVDLPTPTVIYEDADLLVLDKPAGLATHPTASRFRATVTHWLRQRGHAEPAHRLDVETSGVLVCGQHKAAARALKLAFAARTMHKRYLAVVEGVPKATSWTDERPLGFDPNSAVRLKMGHGDKPAGTAFERLTVAHGRALVAASPLTGRQHQIRAHLALSGTPIVGDKLYGPDEHIFLRHLDELLTDDDLLLLGCARHALHAHQLAFRWRGATLSFEAPWPAELQALIDD